MARQSFFVLSPVSYDRRYKAGETIEMERAEALQLLDLDVICDPEDPRAAAFGTDPVDEAGPGILEQALDALRQAPAEAVRAFFERVGEDPEIRAKLDDIAAEAVSIEDAIRRLDPDDPTLWTGGGKPRVEAVEALLGHQISSDERDAAWETVEAVKAAAGSAAADAGG